MVRARWMALLAVVGLAYLPRLDDVCGLFSDDAWYVVLARALATGEGYTLTNLPTPGVAPVYPPGFPLLLSLVFRMAPGFPGNVVLLKAVSIVSMAAVAVLTIRYCCRDQGFSFPTAWLVALATAVHPAFVFLATSTVMSECVFTLLALAAVIVVESALRDGRGIGSLLRALLGGAIASFAFLTRAVGIAVVFAGLGRLLLRRRWTGALAFVLAAATVAAPWLFYAREHAATPAIRAEANDGVVYPYSVQFWHRVAGAPRLGTVTARDLPGRVAWNAWMVARSSAGALHLYFPFRSLEPAAWRVAPEWARALAVIFSAVVLLGFAHTVRERPTTAEILVPASLAIALAWPFPPTRYVLPLLPFVLCYTARGVAGLARLLTGRERTAVAPALLWGLIAASMTTNGFYHGPAANRPRWNRIFEERQGVVGWLAARVPGEQVIATQDPAHIHLYSGQKTVGFIDTAGAFDGWRRLGVRFFAETHYRAGIDPTGREIDPALAAFTPVYRTPTFGFRVLDLGRLYGSRRD